MFTSSPTLFECSEVLVITVYGTTQPFGFEGSAVKIYRLAFGKAFIVAGVFTLYPLKKHICLLRILD